MTWRTQVLSMLLVIMAGMAASQTPAVGVWHQITEDSPFFAGNIADLHGAAILQEDGRFAMLVLGTAEEGALVSVNVQMAEPASELTSTLVMPAGGILVRPVDQDQLLSETAADGESVTYSFGIAPEDVERFMSALLWRVKAGDRLTTISLDGSRDAIAAAMAARDHDRTDVTPVD